MPHAVVEGMWSFQVGADRLLKGAELAGRACSTAGNSPIFNSLNPVTALAHSLRLSESSLPLADPKRNRSNGDGFGVSLCSSFKYFPFQLRWEDREGFWGCIHASAVRVDDGAEESLVSAIN
jgi:hypothetical protein